MLKDKQRVKYEHRNRQVTVVYKPSTYQAAKKIASITGCSTNNILNIALEEYIERNQDKIAQYDKEEGEHEEDN